MIKLGSLHPITAGMFVASVLVITMFAQNPILHAISFIGAMLFFIKVNKERFLKGFLIYLCMTVGIAAVNPLFSHKGATVLFVVNKNPITLEALLYGFGMALTVIAVIYWFKCFNTVMTEDKLLCLFGGISPKLALLLSSSLRFVPLLSNQSKKIKASQKAMGMYSSDAYVDKVKNTMRTYSALVGWALENAVDVGTSMKSRGYGLKGRTHFSLFRITAGDVAIISLIALLDVLTAYALFDGSLDFGYYPEITVASVNTAGIIAITAFSCLCFLPFILEVKEELQWKYYKSRI